MSTTASKGCYGLSMFIKSRPQPAEDYSDYNPYDQRNPAQMWEDLREQKGEFARENDSVHRDVFDQRTNRFREKMPFKGIDPTKPFEVIYNLEDIPGIEVLDISRKDLINIRKKDQLKYCDLQRIQINAQLVINMAKQGINEPYWSDFLTKTILKDSARWTHQPHVNIREQWLNSLQFADELDL